MNAITPFDFDQQEVRVVDQDGQPWFVVADVCAVLGLSNPTMAVKALDDDERSKLNLGRQGEATIINEGGLYTLILRCRDAMTPDTAPYRFRKWVTAKVLPAIRRSGQFSASPAPLALDDPATLRAALLGYTEKVIELEAANVELEHKVEALEPMAEFYQRFANADGLFGIQQAARALNQPPNKFAERLRPRYLFYQDGVLTPRSEFVQRGIFLVKSALVVDKVRARTWITPKGILYFGKKLGAQLKVAA